MNGNGTGASCALPHGYHSLLPLDRYDDAEFESALEDALARGAVGVAPVAHAPRPACPFPVRTPKLDVFLPDEPPVRRRRHHLEPGVRGLAHDLPEHRVHHRPDRSPRSLRDHQHRRGESYRKRETEEMSLEATAQEVTVGCSADYLCS